MPDTRHGKTVGDGWARAMMEKILAIQKCDGPTNGQTDRPTDKQTVQQSKVLSS